MTKSKSWPERISLAQQNGYFQEEDSNLASEWMTCAVGENAKETNIAPIHVICHDRQSIGDYFGWKDLPELATQYISLDERIDDLGMEFMSTVQTGHYCVEDKNDASSAEMARAVKKAASLFTEISQAWDKLADLRRQLVSQGILSEVEYNLELEAKVRKWNSQAEHLI